MEKIKTLKVRVKDKHAKLLKKMAGAVNFVWNYINELSSRSIRECREFLSAYDRILALQGLSLSHIFQVQSFTLACLFFAEYTSLCRTHRGLSLSKPGRN